MLDLAAQVFQLVFILVVLVLNIATVVISKLKVPLISVFMLIFNVVSLVYALQASLFPIELTIMLYLFMFLLQIHTIIKGLTV